MPTKAEFHRAIESAFREARARGADHVLINSGELHRRLGGYPGPDHQMPSCCDAMYEKKCSIDTIVEAPNKGKGASLTIQYRLPRILPPRPGTMDRYRWPRKP